MTPAGLAVTGTGNFAHGNLVKIEAIPSKGFEFVGWSGDLAGENPTRSKLIFDQRLCSFPEKKNEIIYINGQPPAGHLLLS